MTLRLSPTVDRRRLLQQGALLTGGLVVAGTRPGRVLAKERVTTLATSRPIGSLFAPGEGSVFVGTNHNNTSNSSEPANQITMYRRAVDGQLELIDSFATGGQGSGPGQRFAGDGLGAGNSVRLSTDNRWLFVTNAGSDTVTVFKVSNDGLEVVDIAPTGDGSHDHRFPNSVTQYERMVYVLNSADDGSIAGFTLSNEGHLTAMADSTRSLDANQRRFAPDALLNPAQVAFTPDGSHLVVTIKDGPAVGLVGGVTPTGFGRVLVWNMDENGRPADDFVQTDLENRGPFGFSFDRNGHLLIAEFLGGGIEEIEGEKEPTAAAGSYTINNDGTLTPITPGVPNHQVDTCWLVNNGRYAYGANYTSGTISSYSISDDGSLVLLESVAGEAEDPGNEQGATPLDARISQDDQFLYVVLSGAGKVAGWHIEDDGTLTKLGEFEGLPQAIDGDQASSDFSDLGSPAGIEVI